MRHILQLKLPRILNLVQESSRPDENEVKSEAQFQRLVASFSELPMQPRTPRVLSDRGRYPEEVSEERGAERCQTPSDDSDYEEADGIPFAFPQPTQEPITIRTRTPAASVSGSLCGDDMIFADSPGAAMDVDAVRVCPFVVFLNVHADTMAIPVPIIIWLASRSLASPMEIYTSADVVLGSAHE
jgi:hypothetical protein